MVERLRDKNAAEAENLKDCVGNIIELGTRGDFYFRARRGERGPGKHPQLSFVSIQNSTLGIRVPWEWPSSRTKADFDLGPFLIDVIYP